jgi:pimeloyl-ACP methyl ester carboxylesterase
VPLRPIVDGDVQDAEYEGAEELVLRYYNGSGSELDTVVKLAAYRHFSDTNVTVYAGVRGFRPTTDDLSTRGRISLNWGNRPLDRTAVVPADRRLTGKFADHSIDEDRGDAGGHWSPGAIASPAAGAFSFCDGDTYPSCLEFSSDTVTMDGIGLMMETWALFGTITYQYSYSAPFDANRYDPSTWAPVTFGDQIGEATRVQATVVVFERFSAVPDARIAGVPVYLKIHGSGTLLDESRTDAFGRAHLDAYTRPDTQVRVEIVPPSNWLIHEVNAIPATGISPTESHIYYAVYDGCAPPFCDLADLRFQVTHVPSGPTGILEFSPHEALPRIQIRDAPSPKVVGPTEITLEGHNFHQRMRVWYTTCDSLPLITDDVPWQSGVCSESTTVEASIKDVSVDGSRMTITVESEPAAFRTGSLLVQDLAGLGRTPWMWAPGTLRIIRPTYPELHGFEFENQSDFTSFDAFSSVFTWHAYDCLSIVPLPPVETCPGCRVPNPIYALGFLGFAAFVNGAMDGSCGGMAATSLLFARGDLNPGGFDGSAHFANGLLGDRSTLPISPPKPQRYNARFCDYAQPINFWAHIHVNQTAIVSQEFIDVILGQMPNPASSIAGDPVWVLSRVETHPLSYVVGFTPQTEVHPHAVAPFAVTHGEGLDDTGARVPRPESSLMHVYDSNHPSETRFLEVNRASNTFRYFFGGFELWDGPGLYYLPIQLYQQPRSMPTIERLGHTVLMLLALGADATYSSSEGGTWGWDAAGTWHDNYTGAKAIGPFRGVRSSPDSARTALFFPPSNSPPASIRLRSRGGDYTFVSGQSGVLYTLLAKNVPAGEIDKLHAGQVDGRLRSIGFNPQSSRPGFTPMLGLNLAPAPSMVFVWDGLRIGGNQTVELIAHPDANAVEFRNDTGAPQRPILQVWRSTAAGVLETNVFGPFEIPPDTTHKFSFPSWPDASGALSELDLNRDGTPDVTTVLAANGTGATNPPVLSIKNVQKYIELSWPVPNEPWVLEQTTALDEKWTELILAPQIKDGRALLLLEPNPFQRFFRLRRLRDPIVAACEIKWQPGALTPVFFSSQYLDATHSAPGRMEVWYPSLDGVVTDGPLLHSCGRFPLIVYLHGHCGDKDHFRQSAYSAEQLARCGYVVVVPELPGTAVGTPPWIDPHPDLVLLKDIVTWMRDQWPGRDVLMPPPATAIVGHSYGALLGARLAQEIPVSAYASLGGVWLEWSPLPPAPLLDLHVPALFAWGTGSSEFSAQLGSLWDDVTPPKHRLVFENAQHWDYLTANCASHDDRGPCTIVKDLAAGFLALFISKYMPPENWSELKTRIEPKLLRPSYALTPAQEFFAGAHLVGFELITTRPGCSLIQSWDTGEGTGSITLP